jgi:hypothetical protein
MLCLLGFDWRKSPAHLLLLAKFLDPQTPERFAKSDDWVRVLGEDPRRAIKRLVDEGLLEPVALPELLARQYKVSELKKMLQQRGLVTSGRKEDLIARLIEADPKGMKKAVAGVTLLKCSSQGQRVAEEYLAQERIRRGQMEEDTIEALKRHRFREASLTVASYEAEQVFPRGMGIDWKHYDPSGNVELLTAIFQHKPKRLDHLVDAQIEAVRVAAAVRVLVWNVGQATEWLEANQADGLRVSCSVAIHIVESYARFRVEITRLRRSGYKRVRVNTCNDNLVCDACRRLSTRQYAIDKVPELPYEKCTSEVCRCWIVGSWQ